MHYNEFFMFSNLVGYDGDGNPKKDRDYSPYQSITAMMMFNQQTLNVKNELNGTGCGLIFLKELKEISEMYTNSSYIFYRFLLSAQIFLIKILFCYMKT